MTTSYDIIYLVVMFLSIELSAFARDISKSALFNLNKKVLFKSKNLEF